MYLILIFMILITLLLIVIMTLISLISKKSLVETQKSTPFECGFNPVSNKRSPFSIYFFLIAVLFLIFDIEIIIILPLVLTWNIKMTFFWLCSSLMFMLILILGLYYEWLNGLLNWSN